MTKHNLQQSLVWLLRQSHLTHQNLDHTHLPAISSSPAVDDGSIGASQEMARLQLAPQTSNRTRLLAQNGHTTGLPTPDPSRPSIVRPNTTPATSARPAKNETPVQRSAPQRLKTPASVYDDSVFDDDVLDIDNVEKVDLTSGDPSNSSFATFGTPECLWDEDAATRVWPLSDKRGKKRKSDEYQQDLPSPRARQRGTKRKSIDVQVTSTAFEDGTVLEDFEEEEDVSLTQKPVRPDLARRDSGQQPPPVGPKRKGKSAVRNHVWSEQEKEHSYTKSRGAFGESVPDSDEEELRSPVKDLESESNQRPQPVKIKTPPSSPPPESAAPRNHTRIEKRPAPRTLKPERKSTPELTVSVKQSSSQIEQKLPTPPTEPDTSVLDAGSGSTDATDKSHQGLRPSPAQQAIVAKLMSSGAEGIKDFLRRLEKSKKETHATYAEMMMQDGSVPEYLKAKKRIIAGRITAANQLVELHASYAKIMKEKELCKDRLMEMLENDEDIEVGPLPDKIRELKAEGHAQEIAILAHMRAAGLEDKSPSSTVGALGDGVCSTGTAPTGVLVASTQKVPLRSPQRSSQQSPSRRYETGCQSIVQTPMPNMSARRDDNYAVRDTHHTVKSRIHSPEKVDRFPQPKFQRSDSLRSQVLPAPQRTSRDFTTNMGSPSCTNFPEDNFDDLMEDDDDMLDVADAFEQGHAGFSPRALSVNAPRAPLSQMSDNVRRPAPSQLLPIKQPSAIEQNFPWSKDVLSALRKRFHLEGFRQNQLQAINATLAGKDAFVLMPTGGGKSLCYQLPSIVHSGKTSGVTIVVSPLLSLMQDQVDHLQKLKIQAFLINSEVTREHKDMVFQALRGPSPEKFIQLLYVTPEMLGKSAVINRILDDLHTREKLARIVIDEAHCVSQWGHDFRPDYKDIGNVRKRFHGVPAMALTATATENVKVDVMHNLGMDGCQVFTQSFNRHNLTYEVRPKAKGLATIAEIINTHYRDQSGIIYCLSRKGCEAVAEKLSKEHGVKAAFYHAALEPQQKADVQKRWQRGDCKVIVATIAFGMGIDKPDVRFVIHHSIPKSLEGYYQETGRAGRDGKQSGCYLFYAYKDTMQLKRMINESDGSEQQKERQRQMLRNVVQFCENRSDCRRVQVLAYFNERFTAGQCNSTCDNCNSNSIFETKDFTEHAQHATNLVRHIHQDDVTLLHCVDVYRGAKSSKISNKGHDRLDQYGKGKDLERGDCERLFQRLVSEDALEEYQVTNKAGFTSGYIKLGRKFSAASRGELHLKIQVRISPNGKGKTKASKPKRKNAAAGAMETGVGISADDYPASTNVSSPLQPRSRQAQRRMIMESDEEEADDHFGYFEPVREAGQPIKRRKRQSGPPITIDDRIEGLDEVHRHILNDFVEKARLLVSQTMMEKDLRSRPVADTVLREIAIEFPSTKQAILEIHGMTEDKYKLMGPQLLRLIKSAHVDYEAMMQAQEDMPEERSRRSIVEISDDEDGFVVPDDFAESGDDELDESESSRYFSANGDVDQFNNQMSQIRTLPAASKASTSFKKPSSRSTSGSSSFRHTKGGKKTGGPTRNYHLKSTGAGVKKKKSSTTSRSSGGNASINAYASKKSTGGSRSAAVGGIGMMPT